MDKITWTREIFALALTGAPGSGKSDATEYFARCGATTANADQLAHEVLHSETMAPTLRETFGDGIFFPTGEVSRPALAQLVFANEEARRKLNGLIHPRVRERAAEICNSLPPGSLFAYDIPLLFEAKLEGDYDFVVVMTAPREIRQRRCLERSGWSKSEFLAREASQMSQEEKASRADRIITNTGSSLQLKRTIIALYEEIKKGREG